ncbi:MAG: FtsX-like permease family protein, partial [Muribaculum sp.]|nr:FtsX-like permease family protein [Muribaculum sp.]
AILLIVPAINIASMTNSRMRQRLSEMAVMRSYGCTRWGLMRSLIVENMIMTLCAGMIGLAASLVFARLAPEFLFLESNFTAYSNPTVDFSILFHWSTFFMALIFCFVLNLLSCGIPAWNASRQNIINSLHGNK